jgi:hypothetical protein
VIVQTAVQLVSVNMLNLRAISVWVGLLAIASGCASTKPAASRGEPSFFQVDDEHLVRLNDVRAAEFRKNDPPGYPFAIQLFPTGDDRAPIELDYSDQAKAYAAWKRITRALGGTVHDEQWPLTVEVAKATPGAATSGATTSSAATRPALPTTEEDGYTRLTQQLGWLMKCVDAKLLTDAEYQQGRAWAIAELQANPQGGNGAASAGDAASAHPQFERLYHQLVGLAKSKDSGLLNDDEAAKVRASILRHAGLVE